MLNANTTIANTTTAKTARLLAAAALALGGLTALGTGPLAPTEAMARAQSGYCEVYRGNNKIDENTCLAREICYYNETRRGETCRTEYLWPTNATTLVTYEGGRATLVNGAPATIRNIAGRQCALNTVSGNTFCFRRR